MLGIERRIVALDDILVAHNVVRHLTGEKPRRSPFLSAYEALRGDFSDRNQRVVLNREQHTVSWWLNRRREFLRRKYGPWARQTQTKPWWYGSTTDNMYPSPRHMALLSWAATPTPERLRGWLDRHMDSLWDEWRKAEPPF